MKNNKHLTAAKRLAALVAILLYATVTPASIANYGIKNNIRAFDNGAPFNEVHGVFSLTWIGGHFIVFLIIYAIYMICYGCDKE